MRPLFTCMKIEDFSKDCPGTRYGASPARNDYDVCVSRLIVISFSILDSQPSITVVFLAFPMYAGRVLQHPTIAFTVKWVQEALVSCPSSRRRSNLPRERKHRSMQWTLPPKDFHFPSRAQESVDSPITDHGKGRKASRFLKADAVPSLFFFLSFFYFLFLPATWSLRAPVSNGMSVDYEAEKGTALRESVQLTSVGQMMKPLSIEPIESWRNTRGCSASEVKFRRVKDFLELTRILILWRAGHKGFPDTKWATNKKFCSKTFRRLWHFQFVNDLKMP